ncbi:MAG: BMP family ABC transporter substrate-binding protein [Defluviitaleaceae bacterium]|nr:BMP family ABC transporter substrate-binding protein [Defluviitaleaceae bacterium]
MKRFAKVVSALTAATILMAACAQPAPAPAPAASAPAPAATTEPAPTAEPEPPAAEGGGFELALVTDIGTIDDRSFNQGSWEGLERFALEHGIEHQYFMPLGQGDDHYLNSIALAIQGGAQLVVTPGFLFQPALYQAQELFPDIKFVLLDGVPQDRATSNRHVAPNTVSILYAEEQSGFLAGYAAVRDGFRDLGFIGGMAVPAVVRFGYGFLQGAEHAAYLLELEPGEVSVRYYYAGGFTPTPEAQATAASWFVNDGIEVIFAAAGGLGSSVMAAAEAHGGLIIGVDIDQSYDSPTVITSALKELSNSVYDMIDAFYAGNFPGGQILTLGAADNGVGLPMETSRFREFSQEDYDYIFNQLATGAIAVNSEHEISISALGLELVTVVEVN